MHRGPPSTPGSDPPHNPPALYDQSILFYIASRETNRLSVRLSARLSFGATLQSVEAPRLPEILPRPTVVAVEADGLSFAIPRGLSSRDSMLRLDVAACSRLDSASSSAPTMPRAGRFYPREFVILEEGIPPR